MELPEFWRTEVWHPLSVHFPVAILLVAFLFKLTTLFKDRELWNRGGSVLLYIGAASAWIAIYTGDMADGAVSRTLCDPTILKDHENAAYITGWIFTAAVLVDIVTWLKFISVRKIFMNLLIVFILAVGSGFLIYVGHSGATLVYQQGAGVYRTSEDCQEFN